MAATSNARYIRDRHRTNERIRRKGDPADRFRVHPRSIRSPWENRLSAEPSILLAPQPGPQVALIECPIYEVFFGGARGGGKTDSMLGDFIQHAGKFGGAAKACSFDGISSILKR